MRKKSLGREICFYILLLILSTGFLLVFAYNQSPLAQSTGGDTSFFKLVGQGMTKGLLPYRDFYDTKGPWMFLIQYLGQMIHWGNGGVFLLEVINLFAVLTAIDKIHLLALKSRFILLRLLLLIPYLFLAAVTFGGGNYTEEFSLLPLLVCVYFYIRHLESGSAAHPPVYASVYGAAFGFLAFVRLNSAASVCAIVFCALAHLLSRRQYKSLLVNMLFFCLGAGISIAPVYAYCAHHGIWNEMLRAVFGFGFSYAGDGGFFSIGKDAIPYLLPMLTLPPFRVIHGDRQKSLRFALFILVHILTLLLSFGLGNGYFHYYTLVIPQLTPGMYLWLKWQREHPHRVKPALCMCAACVLLLCPLKPEFDSIRERSHVSLTTNYRLDHHALEIAEHIPESDRDSVYAWDLQNSSRFYYQTGIFPDYKYCDWQEMFIRIRPEIAEEIRQYLDQTPPAWIITKTDAVLPAFLETTLRLNYASIHDTGKYQLWQYAG